MNERRMNSKVTAILQEIRDRLENDVEPCLNRTSAAGGYFSTPLILFACIELLGILYKNPKENDKETKAPRDYFVDAHTKEAIQYIQDYMGKMRAEYKEYAELLYGVYRHSLAHTYQPRAFIKLDDTKRISWLIDKSSRKAKHLTFEDNSNGQIAYKMLRINIDLFFQDLVSSIDLLEKEALACPGLARNIIDAHTKLNNEIPTEAFSSKQIRNALEQIRKNPHIWKKQ